jgi:uncharacterized protein YaaQ
MNTKVILVIVRGSSEKLIHQLEDANYRVTEFSSTGGFLRQKNSTLIIGVPAEKVEGALSVIRSFGPNQADNGGHYATIFVLDASQFVQI